MECHYKVLDIQQDATLEDIKKARDRLAKQYHPDKVAKCSDAAKVEESTATFRLVQEAYDVLKDPQERAWYDQNREHILGGQHGSDTKTFNLFRRFVYKTNSSHEEIFYQIYQKIFNEVTEKDRKFAEDDGKEFEVPSFGISMSSYDDVVGPFYAYWLNYHTRQPMTQHDIYDVRMAANRKTAKMMERDNEKIRGYAKRHFNESVRQLANYIHKQDPRVEAHKEVLAKQAEEKKERVYQQKLAEWEARQALFRKGPR